MTTTQRALIVFVPLALTLIIFIRWTWVVLALLAAIYVLSMFFQLVWSTAIWIADGYWEWDWPWTFQ